MTIRSVKRNPNVIQALCVTAASVPPETSCSLPASASQTLHVCAFGFGPAHGMSERTYVRTSYVSNFLDSKRASSNCIWGRGWPAERMWPCREVGRQRLPGRCSKLITMSTPRHIHGSSSRTASRSGHIAFADPPPPHLPDLVGLGLVADDVRGHGRRDPGEMNVRTYVRAY